MILVGLEGCVTWLELGAEVNPKTTPPGSGPVAHESQTCRSPDPMVGPAAGASELLFVWVWKDV